MPAPSKTLHWSDPAGKTHSGAAQETVGEYTVIACEACGFRHVLPLPTAGDLQSVYEQDYYTQEKPQYIARHLQDQAWWDAVHAERYESLEHYLGGQAGTLLDVGAGPGLFLRLGRERGWCVTGIEPSKQAAQHCRQAWGLEIVNAFLDEHSAAALGAFDVVHMSEVLEHLPDPAATLALTRQLLKPGGLVCLVVPNDFNPVQLILRDQLGAQPWWVAPPHHLNYFSHESLSALLQRQGFEVLHMESTFPIDLFLLMGKNYIGQDEVGREVHALRKELDLNLLRAGAAPLRRQLYTAFGRLGLGREIVVYARSTGPAPAVREG